MITSNVLQSSLDNSQISNSNVVLTTQSDNISVVESESAVSPEAVVVDISEVGKNLLNESTASEINMVKAATSSLSATKISGQIKLNATDSIDILTTMKSRATDIAYNVLFTDNDRAAWSDEINEQKDYLYNTIWKKYQSNTGNTISTGNSTVDKAINNILTNVDGSTKDNAIKSITLITNSISALKRI